MNKVSVIIPVFNEERDIKDCLKSLTQQSLSSFEVVVVDDGSTDRTLEVVSSLPHPGFDLKIVAGKHQGAGAARNLGAKQSNGEVLVFVDADMVFDGQFLEKLIQPIEKEGVVGTFSKEEKLANKDNVWARCWNLNRGLPAERMHPTNYPDHQKVFRAILTSEFKKVGGFNENAGYTDDWLSEKLGVEAVAAPGAIFYHKNPDSLMEVFQQSKWMAKRKYKMGALGYLFALTRVFLPISLVIGVAGSILYLTPAFLIFKIVSDLGQFVGILEFVLKGKVSK